MSDSDAIPSGSQEVCPRCGTAPGEGTWCSGCGLNLRQQHELPTADAYTARVREGRWLADQQLQRQAQREAGEREAAVAQEQRWVRAKQEKAATLERAAAAERGRQQQTTRGKRSRTTLLASVSAGLLLLLGGGVATYVLLSNESSPLVTRTSPTPATPPERSDSEPAPEPDESADDGGECQPAEEVAPPNLFPVEGAPDAIALEATGTSCDTAARLADAYFPAETSQGVTPGQPVDIEGFTCIQTQGSGGSTVECDQGSQQVTFRVGSAAVVPQGFEYCPMYETRDRSVFDAGVRGVACSEAEDVLDQIVQTDAVVGDWACDKDELSVCTSADLGAEIRYRFSVAESP